MHAHLLIHASLHAGKYAYTHTTHIHAQGRESVLTFSLAKVKELHLDWEEDRLLREALAWPMLGGGGGKGLYFHLQFYVMADIHSAPYLL